ncbi:MAG: hypothetical protein ACLQVN_08490 [Bryobacteraceae bacterium]
MTSQLPADVPGAREELDRILCSRVFHDRKTLQHLLEYLVQRTLDGTVDNLKEYVIGVDVFGKPDRYDPQTDASVRVQIGKLRRKLEEYYLDEGVSDSLLLQLPKRHFAVFFERRTAIQPLQPDRPVPLPRRQIAWMRLPHWALTVFLAGWALFLTFRTAGRGEMVSPELVEIWKPFLAGSRPILISLGTLQFYEYSAGWVREPDLDHLTDAERQPRLQELGAMLHSSQPLKPYLVYTGVGQATAAFLLSKQFDRMDVPADLVRSNVLSWDEIAQHNVVFLGSAKLNSQLLEIPVAWAFRVQDGQIVNLQPKPGEAASYDSDYSLVSLFPGLHGRGEILIVESASTTGVWAAAQFLTDPGYAKELVAHLRQPDGQLPRHYQVVLKSQIAAGVPIRISYVTHRSL